MPPKASMLPVPRRIVTTDGAGAAVARYRELTAGGATVGAIRSCALSPGPDPPNRTAVEHLSTLVGE